jgi:hypothetical protein
MSTQHESLVEFLGQVSLFEDLAHRELARVARIVHERQYGDGETPASKADPAPRSSSCGEAWSRL